MSHAMCDIGIQFATIVASLICPSTHTDAHAHTHAHAQKKPSGNERMNHLLKVTFGLQPLSSTKGFSVALICGSAGHSLISTHFLHETVVTSLLLPLRFCSNVLT